MIPFTADQFLNVFEQYNVAVWPAQVFLHTIGVVAICLTLSRKKDFSKGVGLILSLFWIWMGLAYHLWFFSAINKAALIFAAFFVLQGTLFFIDFRSSVSDNDIYFRPVALDQPASSSLRFSYTTSLDVPRLLGRNLLGND